MNSENILGTLVGVACIFAIAAGGIYIGKHVDCWNFFGLYKGCGISTVK